MKITKQFIIAWIRTEGASADELVAVHSRPISSSDANEAWQKFENGKAIEGFIPIVFLDEQLNSSEVAIMASGGSYASVPFDVRN